jgi:hypothetical protein
LLRWQTQLCYERNALSQREFAMRAWKHRKGSSVPPRVGKYMIPPTMHGGSVLTGLVLAALLNSLAGQVALADPPEPNAAEAQSISAPTSDGEDFGVTPFGSLPVAESPNAHPRTSTEIAAARNYLIETASPGYTMTRQGPELAIGRLNPEFAVRLANAVREAREGGLPSAGVFSAYRPPAFGIGGFFDKFHSLHSYGLAVDMSGIGGPGSAAAQLWYEIAARHGVVCPYGSHHQAEWNHCQPTSLKIILAENPLRDTVTAEGPLNLESMFEAGNTLIANPPSNADATGDRIAADQLVPTTAVRHITERLDLRPVTMVNRLIKPPLRSEPPGGMRTLPLTREKVGGFIDERRPLVITVEEGRAILSGRIATAGRGRRGFLSRSGSLTTRTNMATQIVILPVPKVMATIRK